MSILSKTTHNMDSIVLDIPPQYSKLETIASPDQISRITKSLGISSDEITVQKRLGGITNTNYQIKIQDKFYALRLPGKGTDTFLSRKSEKKNTTTACKHLGLTPPALLICNSGIKIVKWFGDHTLTPKEVGHSVGLLTKLLKRLHHSGLHFENPIDTVSMIFKYASLAPQPHWYPDSQDSLEIALKISKAITKMDLITCPIHHDLIPDNILIDENKTLNLIDWEYSGMGHRELDLASLFTESHLGNEKQQQYLKAYNDDISHEAVAAYSVLLDILWSFWGILQHASGTDNNLNSLAYGKLRLKDGMDKWKQLTS
ncbi:MAG: choline kinase family protein [Desulfobacterales bacterium]|nr:choline kinase family protein [Desulfobacterales bacterium]